MAMVCAGVVALTWLVAQQQEDLTNTRAAVVAAGAPSQVTISIEDEPAHIACERIDNHADRALVIDLRSNSVSARPETVTLKPRGSTEVCVGYPNGGSISP